MEFRKKGLPYPEARGASSQYLTGKRKLPSELTPSEEYKKAVTDDLKARLNKFNNVEGDIDSAFQATDAAELKNSKAYTEAVRLREAQKKLDIKDLPMHHKGKINALDKIIQEIGFEKIPHISGNAAKKASDAFSYLQKGTMKVIPGLSAIAAGLGAAGYSDIAGAATDAVIPGGLEETGIADERSIPDPRYQEYIRRMQQRKK